MMSQKGENLLVLKLLLALGGIDAICSITIIVK